MFFYVVDDVAGTPPIVPIFYYNTALGPMDCKDIISADTNKVHALISAAGGKAMLFKVTWSPK